MAPFRIECRCAMSAFGTKRTWANALQMSAFGGKADIAWSGRYVRLDQVTGEIQ